MLPGTSEEVDALMAFKAGNTWLGFDLLTVIDKVTGLPPTTAAAACELIWKSGPNAAPVAIISNGNGMTILDAANWQFQAAKQKLPIKAGTWQWEFNVTDADGVYLTWLQGTTEVVP